MASPSGCRTTIPHGRCSRDDSVAAPQLPFTISGRQPISASPPWWSCRRGHSSAPRIALPVAVARGLRRHHVRPHWLLRDRSGTGMHLFFLTCLAGKWERHLLVEHSLLPPLHPQLRLQQRRRGEPRNLVPRPHLQLALIGGRGVPAGHNRRSYGVHSLWCI